MHHRIAPPPGAQGVLGYIGREGRTPHVWTLPEWDRFAHLKQFPAYVPDLTLPGISEAQEAVKAAEALGWAPFQAARRAIVFDFETAQSAATRAWWQSCAAELEQLGFAGVAYGSLSTVFELAASYVLVADWDGSRALDPGQTVVGHQYLSMPAYDLSAFGQWLWDRGGEGPRHG